MIPAKLLLPQHPIADTRQPRVKQNPTANERAGQRKWDADDNSG
jgi:hypothetical protein